MSVDAKKPVDGNGIAHIWALVVARLAGKVDKVDGKGLSANDYTSAEKTKLAGIADGANKYTHPGYTAHAAGLYKIANDASGHISAATAVEKSDITGLGIPAQDTTYGEATGTAAGLMSAADKTKMDGVAAGANAYVHPSHTAFVSGLYKIVVDALGHVTGATAATKSDITALGIPAQDTTYSAMTGASASADGASGLAPAPTKGAANRYLRSDGSWAVPPDTNTTYGDATTSAHGLLSTADKLKLDGIAAGANNYTHPAHTAAAAGLYKVTVDALGHITAVTAVTKSDITALGIPAQDTNTTYSAATTSANGLMSAADKTKMDAIPAAASIATQTYVTQQVAAAGHLKRLKVDTLPAISAADANTIYMVPNTSGASGNSCDEFMLLDGAWEQIGSTSTTLDYLTNAEIDEILAAVEA
jgi:hypothetical protein